MNTTTPVYDVGRYYAGGFKDDLHRVFPSKVEDDGIDVTCWRLYTRHFRELLYPHFFFFFRPEQNFRRPYKREEEYMFVAMVSYIYLAQKELHFDFSDHRKEVFQMMNDFGFPIFCPLSEGLKKFLEVTDLLGQEELEKKKSELLVLMEQVFPFMHGQFMQHLRTWNNGFFMNIADGSRVSSFEDDLKDTLFRVKRALVEQTGLSGFSISNSSFCSYYQQVFPGQLTDYFDVTSIPGGGRGVLFTAWDHNHRAKDGCAGRNISENYMFSAVILYYILAAQTMGKHAEEALQSWYKCTGWPMISCGLAGPDWNPMYMLRESGLAPSRDESLFYLRTMDVVFPLLEEHFNSFLNGKTTFMADAEAGQQFTALINKHNKKAIRRTLKHQVESLKTKMAAWSSNPVSSFEEYWETEDDTDPVLGEQLDTNNLE